MIQFDNERRHDSPLSPDVVAGFILACNNIVRYGMSSHLKKPFFRQLSISERNELEVYLLQTPQQGATHMDSGIISIPGHGFADNRESKARVWTPMEAMPPANSVLLGEDIQIATVCRYDNYDYDTGLVLPHDIVSTTTGRMFEIVKRLDAINPENEGRTITAGEIYYDEEVEDIIFSLTYAKQIIETEKE